MKTFLQKTIFNAFLILLFLGSSQQIFAQVATNGDYRTRATGTWSGSSTWQVRTSGSWANTTTAPTATANIYVQSGHTLSIDVATAPCNDLQVHTGAVVAIGTNVLQVNGKIRAYTGTAATGTGADGTFYSGQASSTNPGANSITSSGAGKLSIVGNSRTVFVAGEWAGVTTGFAMDVSMNSGQTATAAAGAKAASWTITSGTFDAAANTIGVDNGTTGGNVTIASGATFSSSRTSAGNPVFQRTGSALAGTLTVNGTLRLAGASPAIAMTTIILNGTVNYSNSGIQTLYTAPSQAGAAVINTYTNLTLSGTSAKTLGVNITVNGTLSMQGTASLSLSTFTLTYGSSATLEYKGSATQTANANEFKSSGGPTNLIVDNTNGFRLPFSRTVSGNVTITAGDVQNLSGSAATLTMSGSAAILAVAGSITGTDVGTNNDINLVISGTKTTLSGAGSLVKFLNVTVNSGSTLELTRTLEVKYVATTINGTLQISGGGFLSRTGSSTISYGSSSTLNYNATYTTTSNEFPATGVVNVSITAPTGTATVTLDADKTITGTLAVGNQILNGGKSMSATTITIGTGSMAMGTLTTSTAFTCSGASMISLSGSWNVTGFTKSTSTVDFTNTGGLNNATSFYNLINSGGSRSISQNFDVENTFLVIGGQIEVTGGTGKSLTMSGANATITIAGGSVFGTDAGSGNDLSLIVSGVQTVLNGNATGVLDDEKKFFNVTVNNGSTLILERGILCKYGTFTVNGTIQINANGYIQNDPFYGSNAKLPTYNASTGALIYNNGGTYTSAGEWPSASAPFNVTIQNNSLVTLSGSRTVDGTLTLTAGTLTLGSNNLTIDGSGAISVPSPSATTMIIASSTGQLRKTFAGAGSFTFPVGDNVGTVEYSPVTLNFTGGSFSSAYAGVNVTNSKQTNNTSATDYLNRYWTITTSGITSPICTASFEYANGDIAGTEANLFGGRYLSSTWNCMGAVNTGTNTFSASITAFGDFTAGELAVMGCCINPTSGGTIASAQSICSGDDPVAFTNSISASGYTGTLEYKWQSSTTSAVAGFNDIASTNSATYDASVLTQTTWFKRLARVSCKSNWTGAVESNVLQIAVNPLPTASIASNNGPICPGSTATFNLSGSNGATVTYTINGGSNATVILTGGTGVVDVTNATSNQTLDLVSVTNGSCSSVLSGSSTVSLAITTWTSAGGGSWDNGVPTSATGAVISADYTSNPTDGDLTACSMTVNNGADVVISAGYNVTLNGALTVDTGSAATFTLESNANLIQGTDASNSGDIIVKRDSNALYRLDYTLWSSPVADQNLLAFSPLTSNIAPNNIRFYTYDGFGGIYSQVASPGTTSFDAATGYLIRMPNNAPSFPNTPVAYNGVFTGEPHNGTISLTSLSNVYYGIGNPYPSTISADDFMIYNNLDDALYFWRKKNGLSGSAYATYTLVGGASASLSPPPAPSPTDPNGTVPNGIIQVGQGFIAKAVTGSLSFTNLMRVADNNGQFFRANIEKSRIWLNLSNPSGFFGQTLIAYAAGATTGIDAAIDGKYFNDSQTALTSIINNQEFAIQGRPLPFEVTDVVPLGFKSELAGNFTISIHNVDGLFATGDYVIFLRDNLTNTVHNLTVGNYEFSTNAGVFNTRFELIYQNLLAVNQLLFDANNVVVYKQSQDLVINTGKVEMATVKVYDIRGRLLIEKNNIRASEIKFSVGVTNEVLIIKITSDRNETVTKKIVN